MCAHDYTYLERLVGDDADLLAVLINTWWQRVGNTPASGIHKIMMAEVRNFPVAYGSFIDETDLNTRARVAVLGSRIAERLFDNGAFPIGATVVIYNDSATVQTISITTDTLRQAGTANTGTRNLEGYGLATLVKVAAATWAMRLGWGWFSQSNPTSVQGSSA